MSVRCLVLPRELFVWLQSLDIKQSMNQPKRDFANGYIVAEICSRYSPLEVNIKSYLNGESLESKLNNWSQIEKYFSSHSLFLPRALIDETIHSSTNSYITLIQIIYTHFTGRKISIYDPESNSLSSPSTPPFARDTLNVSIRSLLKRPDIVGGMNDVMDNLKKEKIVEKTIKQINEIKKEERKKENSNVFYSNNINPAASIVTGLGNKPPLNALKT